MIKSKIAEKKLQCALPLLAVLSGIYLPSISYAETKEFKLVGDVDIQPDVSLPPIDTSSDPLDSSKIAISQSSKNEPDGRKLSGVVSRISSSISADLENSKKSSDSNVKDGVEKKNKKDKKPKKADKPKGMDDEQSEYTDFGDKSVGKGSVSSSRIREFLYSPSNVYVIRTKYGYQTNVVFDPKEEIQTMSVGDRSLWQLVPAGNRLFIRPLADNLSTNMTLLTSKRSYEFDLKSVSHNNENNVYVARFVYPDDSGTPDKYNKNVLEPTLERVSAQVLPVSEPAPKPLLTTKNYNYTYSGADDIAPIQVYDDGSSTFVKYKNLSTVIPSAVIIGSDGRESSVGSSVQNNYLVVDGVAGEIALRSEKGEVRIYNETLNPR